MILLMEVLYKIMDKHRFFICKTGLFFPNLAEKTIS